MRHSRYREDNRERCHRCWKPTKLVKFTPVDYAELLGLYLGDGHIVRMRRTLRFRLFLDSKYPGIIESAHELLARCFPENAVGRQLAHGGSMTVLSLYSSHLPCLFPQHGPGMKHQREIVLERWQREQVGLAPWAFVRGLIRSDGCSFVNRTGPYEYLSYGFANTSDQITRLFVTACEELGLRPCTSLDSRGRWQVRINRRESVKQLVAHVGIKK